jgi:hypothetical protein
MDKFLTYTAEQRERAIRETAARMQLHPTPVEKDFWVCWLLRELFRIPAVMDQLIFKGGTSLSKGYGVIQRFSEDIDLSVHASVFGVEIEPDFSELSKSQRDNRIKSLYRAARNFIEGQLIPELRQHLEATLANSEWSLELREVKKDFHILRFRYPKVIADADQLRYARPYIQIEISARAEHEPAEVRSIRPYIAEQFEQLFDQPDTSIKILAARRTFWEKATILHAESSRPASEPMPPRLARHAYDLHQLMACNIGKEALEEIELLERVAKHKAFFYTQAGVDYKQAYSGGLKVVPEGRRQAELEKDYKDMRDFFMSDPPNFDTVLNSLKAIEMQANRQK